MTGHPSPKDAPNESAPRRWSLLAIFGAHRAATLTLEPEETLLTRGDVAALLGPAHLPREQRHARVSAIAAGGAAAPGGATAGFSSLAAAAAWLDAAAPALAGRLAEIADRAEFEVSFSAQRPAAAPTPGAGRDGQTKTGETTESAAGGSAYLRARAEALRAEAAEQDAFAQKAARLAGLIARRLAEDAGGAAPPTRLHMARGGAQLSLLLPRLDGARQLERALALAVSEARGGSESASQDAALALGASGPWPAYSFADIARKEGAGS